MSIIYSNEQWISPNRDLFQDGKLQPQEIQQRFWQKLDNERRQLVTNGNHNGEIQYSNTPDLCTTTSDGQKPKDDSMRSRDSDSMFGDEIPIDDIETLLVADRKENKKSQSQLRPPPSVIVPSSPKKPVVSPSLSGNSVVPSLQHEPVIVSSSYSPVQQLATDGNIGFDDDDDDDMFGDDIPLDLLDEPLASNAKQIEDTSTQQDNVYILFFFNKKNIIIGNC